MHIEESQFFLNSGSKFICQMANIYPLNSRGGKQLKVLISLYGFSKLKTVFL